VIIDTWKLLLAVKIGM